MTVNYYIARPDVQVAIHWTGDNFAEVVAALTLFGYTISEVGNEVLNFNGSLVEVGQWIMPKMGQISDTDWFPLYNNMQVVDTGGPHDYTITTV